MKKILSITLLFFVTLSYSQRWSAYGFKVSPQNEETVVKIIDDYFTANSIEGVTVSLYSIMFTAADLNFTHEVIFSGEAEAMAKLYSPNFQDTAWQLFSSKINNFIEENVFSANGWRAFEFGDVMPFQMVVTFKGDNEKANKVYEFVGPICESTDKFALFKNFQKLKEKDLVIILDVGAYGMSLSSNYNLRPKATELLIKNSKIKIISKRQKLKDLI